MTVTIVRNPGAGEYPFLGYEVGQSGGAPVAAFRLESQAKAWQRRMNTPDSMNQELAATEYIMAKAMTRALTQTRRLPGQFWPTGPEPTCNGYTFADFLKAVRFGDGAALDRMAVAYVEYQGLKVIGDQTGPAGGYLMPPQFQEGVFRTMAEASIVRPRAFPIRLTSRTCDVPVLNAYEGPDGQTRLLGSLRPRWGPVGEQKPETEAVFDSLQLVGHELSAITYVKDALLEDSPDTFGATLRNLGAVALADEVDRACLAGSGVGEPLGVCRSPGTCYVPRRIAGHVNMGDLAEMAKHLLPSSYETAIWVLAASTLEDLGILEDQTGSMPWPWQGQFGGASRPALMFWPFYVTEKTPLLGQTGDVLLCDFRWYYQASHGIAVGMSEHPRYSENITAVRFVELADGEEMLRQPVLLRDGETEASPFVALGQAGAETT